MVRIIKDGYTFECDTEAELRLALGVLAASQSPDHVATVHLPVVPDIAPLGVAEMGEYLTDEQIAKLVRSCA